MSEHEKLAAFGSWLTTMKLNYGNELYQMAINGNTSVDKIRVKAGHLEAAHFILEAFTELYNEPLQKFMEQRLGAKPEGEEDEEKDVSHTR